MLLSSLQLSLERVIDSRIDKKEYLTTKQAVDIRIQSVLFDFCRLLYETEEEKSERFNYPRLLNASPDDIGNELRNRELLGFLLFKDVMLNISELIEFFSDEIETFFLSEVEKRILAKMVYALRDYAKLLHSTEVFINKGKHIEYIIVAGAKVNPKNSPNSYLLVRPLADNEAVVVSGGKFAPEVVGELLSIFVVKETHVNYFSQRIYNIVLLANDWINATGKYFIANPEMFPNSENQ